MCQHQSLSLNASLTHSRAQVMGFSVHLSFIRTMEVSQVNAGGQVGVKHLVCIESCYVCCHIVLMGLTRMDIGSSMDFQ